MKILTVDDDPVFLELLHAVLATSGFEDVTAAASASEAAQIIVDAKPPFDCCFIDMRMPEIEGDYLCKWIRRLPEYRDTVILMITATSEKMDVDRAFLAGASDYMTKPIDLAELIARAKQIAKHGQRMEDPKARKAKAAAAAMPADATAPSAQAAFPDPVKLEGIKRALELTALENYLLQLSRSQKYELSVFAFKIFEAAKLHLRLTPGEFGRVLTAVAAAILETMGLTETFISYAGYGSFVVVGNAQDIDEEDRAALEAEIGELLDALELTQDNGTPIRIRLHVGMPKKLGRWSGANVVDAMYSTLVEADARVMSLGALAG